MSATTREYVIEEIIRTEKTYIQSLEMLMSLFAKPMVEQGLLTQNDYDWVFSDILVILNVNHVLLADLQLYREQEADASPQAKKPKTVGQIFLMLVRASLLFVIFFLGTLFQKLYLLL